MGRAAKLDAHHVVIVGGGFGGLQLARSLHRTFRVTLVDRRNFHLFQPLLYQVATGGLSPANIAAPLRSILRRRKNVRVLMAEVRDFDPGSRRIVLEDRALSYDTLVVATGMRNNYFGHDAWRQFAPGLKTLEDATDMRRRIFSAFESAEREADPAAATGWLTFVVVGGGPTGVELAGSLAEMARHTLRHDFRRIDPSLARIVLVEGSERVLGGFVPKLSAKALHSLRKLGVDVRLHTYVRDIDGTGVQLQRDGESERIEARTVLWAAGVRASRLGPTLAAAMGAETDSLGRVRVDDRLAVPGYPDVFVIGDLAYVEDRAGEPLPGVAPVAIQQGRYVARLLRLRQRKAPLRKFRYRDPGSLATIGRSAAVADLGWCRLSGLLAWIAWLFVHLIKIVELEKRFLVFTQWAWSYLTYRRTARLIVGQDREDAGDGASA